MIGPCSLCKAECCKSYVITATIFDILRIAKATGRNAHEFTELHRPCLLGYDPENVLDTQDRYGRYLLGLKSHPCVFLDLKANKCTIHGTAPLSCRAYPYRTDLKLTTRFCPFFSSLIFRMTGPDVPMSAVLDELRLHQVIVKKWNAQKGLKKDCLDFLIREAALSMP